MDFWLGMEPAPAYWKASPMPGSSRGRIRTEILSRFEPESEQRRGPRERAEGKKGALASRQGHFLRPVTVRRAGDIERVGETRHPATRPDRNALARPSRAPKLPETERCVPLA